MVKEFTFKNKKYIFDEEYWDEKYKKEPILVNSLEFQLNQFEYLFEIKDYTTIKNRIINMLKWGGDKTIRLNMEDFKIYIILTCYIIGLIVLTILINLYPYITLGAIILGGVIYLRIVGSKNIKWEEDERDRHHFL